MKKLIYISIIFIFAFFLILLIYKGQTLVKDSERLKVATTVFPLYDITRNIAGDEIEVVNILPTGASPHTFELTPSVLKKLEGAEIIFQIGLGLDDWVEDIVSNLGKAKVVPLYEEIGLIEENPHYWLSVTNAKIMAKNITRVLVAIDGENATLYQKNFEIFTHELDEVKVELTFRVKGLKRKEMVTFHDAWVYFAKDFGLEVVAEFEPFPGKEPTSKYLAKLHEIIKKYNIKTIFSEPQLSNETIKPFVEDLGITLKVLDPLGGVEGRESYINLMRYNVNMIVESL